MPLFLLVLSVVSMSVWAQSPPPVGYDFDQPVLLAEMPGELEEISGLSPSPEAGEILAVQDEDGKFFRLSLDDGRMLGATKFHEDADYEGIELVGNDVWIVKSTGTLYRISRPGLADQETTKFNGFLTRENDVEGLAYDRANHRLLLACKDESLVSGEVRAVFAFDLTTEEFSPEPVYQIGRSALQNYLENCPRTRRHQKIMDFIIDKKQYELGPSAIAIHPLTGQLFVVSSPGKLIILLNTAGQIQHVRRLDKAYFPQPEGIMFLPDGTLLLSTEAKSDEPARIYKIPYQPGFTGL